MASQKNDTMNLLLRRRWEEQRDGFESDAQWQCTPFEDGFHGWRHGRLYWDGAPWDHLGMVYFHQVFEMVAATDVLYIGARVRVVNCEDKVLSGMTGVIQGEWSRADRDTSWDVGMDVGSHSYWFFSDELERIP